MAKKNKQREQHRPDQGAGMRVPDSQPGKQPGQGVNASPTLYADVDGGRLLRDTDAMSRQDYLERYEGLKLQADKGWLKRWKDIRDHLMPERGLFEGEVANSGDVNFSKVLDIQIHKSICNLATMLQGGFSSPSKAWARLTVSNPELADSFAVKTYLAACEKVMYKAWRGSDFYDSIYSLYLEIIAFGTGVIYCEEDWQRLMNYRTLTIGEFLLDADQTGRVDTLYRVVNMTARQMGQKFKKERLSIAVQNSLRDNPEANHRVLHVICPRKDYDRTRKDNLNMPFKSVWLEIDGRNDRELGLLGECGYMEQPFMAARWDVVGSNIYGIGPGWYALPEVKTHYQACGDFISAIHKVLNPPMLVPSEYRDRIVHLPGGQTYGDEQIKPLYQINPDLTNQANFLAGSRDAIKGEFYSDVFIFSLDHPNMTAFEASERIAEKSRLLGPALNRLESDLFIALVDRQFSVLFRAGMFPPAPDELRGEEVKVEFIGDLAMQQKESGTRSIQKTVTFGLELAKFQTELIDKLDLDKAVDEFHELTGSPPAIVRPEEQVQALRAQRQAAMQAQAKAQQQLEMAKVMPQAAQTLSQTPMGAGNNALDSIMGAGNADLQTEPLGPPAGPRPFGLPG